MTSAPRRPTRADALRNYERLVAAATDAFAEYGPQVPLDDIARAAGVGNATLYRHFPTRQALLEAVHHDHVEALARRAGELTTTHTPAEALALWLETLVAQGSATRGLAASLLAVIGSPTESWCRERIFAAANGLLRHAQEAGEIRSELTASQLLKLVNAIALATEQEPDGHRQAHTLLTLVFDGIRVHA
ncbi:MULTISPECIES: TetR/AcrR family transcriptional regulator [Nocardia]|uniref:TetR/AcrR family transcriptional regulator n=2 Tax=Nocardia TaxID=1817 RepID=A0A2T2ZA96_9NOCA|nr:MULTISPECIES: TetR/AcrR family transcriptional regulator [Nocardia]MBF6449172.1 TetR/AcrR family transcriptional regulator [Nocardia elegans]PSR64671.1 TetR/AcrR family transcriptional regulator [Nocardia nova]